MINHDRQSRSVAPGSLKCTASPAGQAAEPSLSLHRFGGLKERFGKGHYKEVRLADPFAGNVLAFPTSLHADNWLLRRFTRGVHECRPNPQILKALHRGVPLEVRRTLLTTTEAGTLADFVEREPTRHSDRAWERFVLVAKAHGFEPHRRPASLIRENWLLIRNLERMRQLRLMHLHQAGVADTWGLALHQMLKTTRINPSLATVCDWMAQSVDSVLVELAVIGLYQRGVVELDVGEVPYGDEITIQLL